MEVTPDLSSNNYGRGTAAIGNLVGVLISYCVRNSRHKTPYKYMFKT